MPGALFHSNVHITTPIQKEHWELNPIAFVGVQSNQPEMVDHLFLFSMVPENVILNPFCWCFSLNIMLGTIAFDEDMDFQGLFTAGGCFYSTRNKKCGAYFYRTALAAGTVPQLPYAY